MAMTFLLGGLRGSAGIVPNMEPGKRVEITTFGCSFFLNSTSP